MKIKKDTIKNFLKGGHMPAKPLVCPIIFHIAAKVEGIAPQEFLMNATKVSNTLRTIAQYHNCDCIFTYFCNHIEEEAVGCVVERSTFPPKIEVLSKSLAYPKASEINKIPYATIVKDIIQRLKIVTRGQSLLAIAIWGPMKLAKFISKTISDYDLEIATLTILNISKWFCQSGVDIIFFIEDESYLQNSLTSDWLYDFHQISKLIAFHEALPVLMVPTYNENGLHTINEYVKGDYLPCFVCENTEKISMLLDNSIITKPVGISIPVETLLDGNLKGFKDIMAKYKNKILLITTSDEIPYDNFEPKKLKEVIKNLKSIL